MTKIRYLIIFHLLLCNTLVGDVSAAGYSKRDSLSLSDDWSKKTVDSILDAKKITFEELIEEINGIDKNQKYASQEPQSFIQVVMILGICFVIILSASLFITVKRMKILNQMLREKNRHLRLAQEKLIQTEKMAVIGQLSSNISHEMNSPLGVIRGTADYLLEGLEVDIRNLRIDPVIFDEEVYEYLTSLVEKGLKVSSPQLSTREERKLSRELILSLEREGIQDAKEIFELLKTCKIYTLDPVLLKLLKRENSKDVLTVMAALMNWVGGIKNIRYSISLTDKIIYSMRSYAYEATHEEKEVIDIVQNVETVLDMYELAFKKGVVISREISEVAKVKGYPEQLKQVWINLIVNGLHAMGHEGEFKIAIKQEQEKVLVSMIDSGHGIPEEIQNKIFDPLYTTKEKGEGSGLGLDIVKQIIDRHDGTIEVQSVPGRTVFNVKLDAMSG